MVSLFLGSLGAIYLVSAPCFFKNWFSIFEQEADKLTPEEKQLSMATLVTASVLWPVVVPFAYMEKVSKAKITVEIEEEKVGCNKSMSSAQIESLC
ncbi:hypothetical protein NG798_05730 [Ancylothrix sp. C2]|uniref:hypothetical protein n=1 Tax=Ancylothrix sp. D3o TaxID=2953691 RepID=UPI0021BB97A8|nr:hypothetical protein [Ancylothrix sp. D3o]MCT7949280.1 hypothetical protein [Ancylothrix sp. D3o]